MGESWVTSEGSSEGGVQQSAVSVPPSATSNDQWQLPAIDLSAGSTPTSSSAMLAAAVPDGVLPLQHW